MVTLVAVVPAKPCGCGLSWTGSSGGGVKNCDCQTRYEAKDKYNVPTGDTNAWCSLYLADGTIQHVSCSAVTSTVVGVTTLTSTETYKFCAKDCNFHNLVIKSCILCPDLREDCQLTPTPIGVVCNKQPNGATCP